MTARRPPEGAQRGGKPPGVAEWAREKLQFEADPVQERVLAGRGHRVLLNCSRQWGKSTLMAVKAVHTAWTGAETLTLVVSPSARQSGEFVRKAGTFARQLGVKPKGDGDNEMSLAFPNGSRIVGLPGNEANIRGFSAVSLLLVDEASRVSDDLYRAIRPMLAVSDGGLWLISTPFGKRGFFYEAWEHGREDWGRFRVTGAECPRIRPEVLEGELGAMGEHWFRQEYGCEFVDAVSGVFERDLVDGAMCGDVEPLEFD